MARKKIAQRDSTTSAVKAEDSSPDSTNSAVKAEDGSPDSTNSAVKAEDSSPVSTNSAVKAEDDSPAPTNSAVKAEDSSPDPTNSAIKAEDSSPDPTNSAIKAEDSSPDSTNSAIKAEDIHPSPAAEFRSRWTPTEFCWLSCSERTAILLAMLTNPEPIVIVQVVGGFNFATEHTPIHGAMPLLYDFNTNKQIAREACIVFYQNNTFTLSSRWLPYIASDQTDTWIMRETLQPQLLFRNLQILVDHYEPQTPDSTPFELAILLTCHNLERLDIEICTPETFAQDLEAKKEHSINEAKALGPVIRELRGKFEMALKVWVGGPFATHGKEDITWMWDRPSEELVRIVTSGNGTESQEIMHLMWTVWSLGGG